MFLGKDPDKPIVDTSIHKPMREAAKRAGIKKRVYSHVLRHSYANGLLESGVDLLTISKLLCYVSFTTMMKYLHCRLFSRL
ncbi:MAG: tyrosine-type recombinase/integrase [Pirellulaceae bacterium]